MYVIIFLYYIFAVDELNGKRDFDNTIQEVIIRPTNSRDDYTAIIPITLDTINEADEGFMVVMRANEVRSNAGDVENLEFLGNGVTLAVIRDDDRKCCVYSTAYAQEIHMCLRVLTLASLLCFRLQIHVITTVITRKGMDDYPGCYY